MKHAEQTTEILKHDVNRNDENQTNVLFLHRWLVAVDRVLLRGGGRGEDGDATRPGYRVGTLKKLRLAAADERQRLWRFKRLKQLAF